MVTTPYLGIALVEQAQAQKEVTVNQALMRLDAAVRGGVLDKDLSTPPTSPAQGDAYLVATTASGAWAGKEGQIAYFDQLWRFISPDEGMLLWVADENTRYFYDGSAWRKHLLTTRTLWLGAESTLRPTLTAGCATAASLNMAAGGMDIITLNFDATTPESACATLCLPNDLAGDTLTAALVWSHASASGSFGTVWKVEAQACADSTSLTGTYSVNTTVSDTGGSANTLYISPTTASITLSGLTPGQLLALRITRLATDSGDTLSVDARLHGVQLTITAQLAT